METFSIQFYGRFTVLVTFLGHLIWADFIDLRERFSCLRSDPLTLCKHALYSAEPLAEVIILINSTQTNTKRTFGFDLL